MSFDIFIQSHRDGDVYWIPSSEMHRRFAGHIEREEPGFWSLTFNNGQEHGEVFTDAGDLSNGFMVARPPHSLQFWEIIAGILRDFPCVLFWPPPKGTCPIVGRLDTISHLPAGMVEDLGVPIVSTDPAYIRSYVGKNS
jgi:hypothetical protein